MIQISKNNGAVCHTFLVRREHFSVFYEFMVKTRVNFLEKSSFCSTEIFGQQVSPSENMVLCIKRCTYIQQTGKKLDPHIISKGRASISKVAAAWCRQFFGSFFNSTAIPPSAQDP